MVVPVAAEEVDDVEENVGKEEDVEEVDVEEGVDEEEVEDEVEEVKDEDKEENNLHLCNGRNTCCHW